MWFSFHSIFDRNDIEHIKQVQYEALYQSKEVVVVPLMKCSYFDSFSLLDKLAVAYATF